MRRSSLGTSLVAAVTTYFYRSIQFAHSFLFAWLSQSFPVSAMFIQEFVRSFLACMFNLVISVFSTTLCPDFLIAQSPSFQLRLVRLRIRCRLRICLELVLLHYSSCVLFILLPSSQFGRPPHTSCRIILCANRTFRFKTMCANTKKRTLSVPTSVAPHVFPVARTHFSFFSQSGIASRSRFHDTGNVFC